MSLDDLAGRVERKYIELMRSRGIELEDLALMSERELAGKIGVDRKLAREILKEASKLLLKPVTAEELMHEEILLKTGLKGVDELLGGGFRLRTINGIYGPPSSGKTQFCIHVTVRSLLSVEKGGLSSEAAAFVDTEGTFDPMRASVFLKRVGLSGSELPRVKVMRVQNVQQLHQALELSLELVKSGQSKFVCIDSISNPFRDSGGLAGLKERQEELQRVLTALRGIVERGSIVLMTMHAIKWGREIRSKGGFVLAHAPHNMLCFRRVRGSKIVVTLEDSSYLPPGQAAFAITEEGLLDL